MRKVKTILLTMLLVIAMLSLTACGAGATVNTTLTINKDFSGTRTMQMVFSNSTFSQYFQGTVDDLNATLNESIPSEMTYDYSEADGNYYYQFYIQFSSIEDYSSKVNAILGEERNVVITCPDSVWVNGVYVEEDFTSPDLLRWLSDALVSKGQLSESYVSNLFGTGDTKVVFEGNEITSGTQIYVDQIEYQRINSVNVYTDIEELNTFNRTVEFVVPKESMNNKGEEIEGYMSSVTPGNASYQKEESGDNTIFTYKVDAVDSDGLDTFMKGVFGVENASSIHECVDNQHSPFSFNNQITDQFSLNNYVLGNISTEVRCYAKSNVEDYVFSSELMGGEEEQTDSEYTLLMSQTYNGSNARTLEVPVLIQKIYSVSKVDAEVSRDAFSNWKRTIIFTLDRTPEDSEIEEIKNKIEAKYLPNQLDEASTQNEEIQVVGTEEGTESAVEEKKAKNVTSVSTKKGDSFSVTISQKGKLEDVQRELSLLFDANTVTNYTCESGLIKVKRLASIEDELYLGNYVEYTTPEYCFDYALKLGTGAKLLNKESLGEGFVFEGGKLKLQTTSSHVSVDAVYEKIDFSGIGFIVLLVAGIALIVIAILTSCLKSNNKKKEGVAGLYCASCGKLNPASNAFCMECGKKMGE